MTRQPLLPRAEYLAQVPKKRLSGSVVLLNEKKDAVLMVKPWYKEWWTFPGGVANAGESPRQAAIRELKEELGLEIQEPKFVGLTHLAHDPLDDVVHVSFFGGTLDDSIVQTLQIDRDEIDDCKFVPLDELEKYATVGKYAREIREIIAAAVAGQPHYFEEGAVR